MRPYEKTVSGLVVEGGSAACFTINYPTRVYLKRIAVTQTDGVLVDFDVDLLSRGELCELSESSSDSESASETDLDVPWEHYKVCATLAGSSGVLAHQFDPEVLYINRDESDHPTPTYRIYVRIAAEGTGDKEFMVTLCSTSAVQ